MIPFLIQLLTFSRPVGYFLIFFGLALEGDFVLLVIAFLTHLGLFDLGDALIFGLTGLFIGDTAWLYLGKKLDTLSPWVHRQVMRLTRPMERHILANPARAIFISKFTYGIHRAVIIRLGQNGLSLKEFLKADLPAGLLWFTLIFTLGYAASASLRLIRHYLHYTELGFLFVLILFFLISHLVSNYSKEKLWLS